MAHIEGSMAETEKINGISSVAVYDKTGKTWDEEMKIRKAAPNKSLRITWSDGSKLDVGFYAMETSKSQVSLQQTQLSDPEAAQAAKSYWQEALASLKELLEQHD